MIKILSIIALISQTIIAIDFDYSRLDSYLSSIEKKDNWSGCVLITNDDSIIYQRSCGYADYENKIPFTLNTAVNVASTGKIFTGTLIVKLVQEGLIKFSDTIGTYFPELPYGSKITLHQLLTHSSGLGSIDREMPGFSYKNITCCTDLMDFIKKDTLKFIPGKGTFYSNTGMFLLGALVEKLRGKSFQTCVEDEIFRSFKMDNSFFKNDLTIDKPFREKHNVAYYYEKKNRKLTRWIGTDTDGFVVLSAGGITMSAKDLFNFQNALLQGKILNHSYLDTMLTPYVSYKDQFYWAYGWIVRKNRSVGSGNLGTNNLSIYRNENLTIIVTQNCGWFINADKVKNNIERIVFKKENFFDRVPFLNRIFHSIQLE